VDHREGKGMSIVLAFLRANWLLTLLIAALAVQTVRIEGLKIWPLSIAGLKTELQAEKNARRADRDTYARAQAEARAKNEAEVKRITDEQERKSAEAKSNYERDLARVRAGGVRKDLAAPSRNPGGSKAGTVPQAACRDDEQNLCVSRARVLQAAEIELGRNALIDWINEQLKVAR
jgi:hypothetical protein